MRARVHVPLKDHVVTSPSDIGSADSLGSFHSYFCIEAKPPRDQPFQPWYSPGSDGSTPTPKPTNQNTMPPDDTEQASVIIGPKLPSQTNEPCEKGPQPNLAVTDAGFDALMVEMDKLIENRRLA